jgi:hypothetical protein
MISVNSNPRTFELDASLAGLGISNSCRWSIVGLLFSASMVN